MNIDYQTLGKFYKFVTYNFTPSCFLEIRLMNIEDKRLYKVVQRFAQEYPEIVVRKNSQFFINSFNQLKSILDYKQNIFIKYSKVCYSISPKTFVNGDISGSYDNVFYTNLLFLDIEKTNHDSLSKIDYPYITSFIKSIVVRLKSYGLIKHVKVFSGGGFHLLYALKRMPVDKERIEGYKTLVRELEELSTPLYKIDKCLDLTRAIALPETWNHKRKCQVKVISTIPENPINDFFIKKVKKKKRKSRNYVKSGLPEIRQSVEWKIITHPELETGDIHTTVLFALKLLLVAHGLTNEDDIVSELEDELNDVRGTNHRLDLEKGLDDKEYNPGIILNWKKKHAQWCADNLK